MKASHVSESDAQRESAAPGRAFDWVFREIELPTEKSRADLHSAWLRVVNGSHAAGVRALAMAWPPAAKWPSGEDYLRTLGWHPESDFDGDEDAADAYADEYDGPSLFDLLFWRLSHMANRLFRDGQVLRLIDRASPAVDARFTHVVQTCDSFEGNGPCGSGESVLSVDMAIPLLLQHAHDHPACGCTFAPKPSAPQ